MRSEDKISPLMLLRRNKNITDLHDTWPSTTEKDLSVFSFLQKKKKKKATLSTYNYFLNHLRTRLYFKKGNFKKLSDVEVRGITRSAAARWAKELLFQLPDKAIIWAHTFIAYHVCRSLALCREGRCNLGAWTGLVSAVGSAQHWWRSILSTLW